MAKQGPKLKDIYSGPDYLKRPYSDRSHFEEAGLEYTFLSYPGRLAEEWNGHKIGSLVLVTVNLPEDEDEDESKGAESYVYEFAIESP